MTASPRESGRYRRYRSAQHPARKNLEEQHIRHRVWTYEGFQRRRRGIVHTVTHVASDVFGTSGRRMLAALIAGKHDPQKLTARALGKLRRKLPQLALALTSQFTDHHGRIMQGTLERIGILKQISLGVYP